MKQENPVEMPCRAAFDQQEPNALANPRSGHRTARGRAQLTTRRGAATSNSELTAANESGKKKIKMDAADIYIYTSNNNQKKKKKKTDTRCMLPRRQGGSRALAGPLLVLCCIRLLFFKDFQTKCYHDTHMRQPPSTHQVPEPHLAGRAGRAAWCVHLIFTRCSCMSWLSNHQPHGRGPYWLTEKCMQRHRPFFSLLS
jgi:hypothetical protein